MISVICSVYNASEFLLKYCESINVQYLKNFEVIFIDANSTDNSREIIESFRFREDIEVKKLWKSSRIPLYDAWNIAILEAKYDWVLNYNCDDYLYPFALVHFVNLAIKTQEFNPTIIYSNCLIVDRNNEITGMFNWPIATMETLKHRCVCGPFPLLKKKDMIEAGLFSCNFGSSGDYEMWCRLVSKGYKVYKDSSVLGWYYKNPEGLSTNPKKMQEIIDNDNKIRSLYSGQSH